MSTIWAPVLGGGVALGLVLLASRRSSGRMSLTYRLDIQLRDRSPHPPDVDADQDVVGD
jgi:hypothetical protein